jgi:hypothetical protein
MHSFWSIEITLSVDCGELMKTRWRCARGTSAAVRQGALGCTLIAWPFCKRDTDLSHVRLAQMAAPCPVGGNEGRAPPALRFGSSRHYRIADGIYLCGSSTPPGAGENPWATSRCQPHLQWVAIARPKSRRTIENAYGGSPDRTDPTAHFAFNQGFARADAVLVFGVLEGVYCFVRLIG